MTDWNPSRFTAPGGIELARATLSRVMLLVPTYDEPTRQAAKDLRLLSALGAREVRLSGMSNVGCARNTLLARWLDGDDRDWALWIDDDVSAARGPFAWVEWATQALDLAGDEARPPIFAGAYPCKTLGGGTLACVFLDPGRVVLGEDAGGYHRADWIGGGAVLMHRATVDHLARELGIPGAGRVRYLFEGEYFFGPQLWRNGLRQTADLDPELGVPVLEEHGEDVGLSAVAARAAVPLLVDTRLRLDHRGRHSFTWEDALGPRRERAPSLRLDRQRLELEATRALVPDRLPRLA